ncbi:GNAT family N-acetyltransferase [Pseudooceanicola nanhaiensis]|uniref:GNAT family N-acetyltransferase n=1 Tax=Pseudooceanicola nanhaiensis TaxID=375761 RepID=UPI001CD7CD6C|nr:GNAT family N-acetyltransferase [Pseudooceanicola nanhaiensis]MCA0918934.1 GNAT family N-acetyltransferase [Pseudooceanicola nanhaiensis]
MTTATGTTPPAPHVRAADPTEPGCAALLDASHALMRALFNPEENHFLPHEALRAPDIRFFAAGPEGAPLGVAALQIKEGYGEVKSFFVAPEARGMGIGATLVARVEAEAKANGLTILRLETGEALDAACRLYERHGFVRRGAFGDYPDNGVSVFMEKRLA